MQQKKPFHYPESIRVVPLHQPAPTVAKKKKKKKAAAQLTYRGGALIPNVEVFTIFWGEGWQTGLKDTANQINQFFQTILQSALMDQLSEYNVPKYTIGKGTLTGTTTDSLGQFALSANVGQTLVFSTVGFITQEIGREINTLGSKSNHVEMQKIVVLMKDHLEKIKEQVLNTL